MLTFSGSEHESLLSKLCLKWIEVAPSQTTPRNDKKHMCRVDKAACLPKPRRSDGGCPPFLFLSIGHRIYEAMSLVIWELPGPDVNIANMIPFLTGVIC